MSGYVLIKKIEVLCIVSGRLYLTLFFSKFILCPECKYSAVCWCENDYVYFSFVLSANIESMRVICYV